MEIKKLKASFVVICLLLVISIPTIALQSAFAEDVLYNVVVPRSGVETLDGSNTPVNNKNFFVGEEFTATSSLLGLSFDRIQINMDKVNPGQTLVGTIYVGVWDSTVAPTTGNALAIFGTMPANSVSDAQTAYNFTRSTAWTLEASQAVGAYYQDLGTGGGVFISGKTTAFDGTATRATCYTVERTSGTADCYVALGSGVASQWVDDTSIDIIMKLISSDSFCDLPENENLLRCKLEAQGGALGGGFANNPFDVSTSSSNILIQVGFLDGSDDNPATNGTGYLLLAIAIIIANTLLWIGTGGAVFKSTSIFLPALVSLVIVMGFTIGGLVDATALILSIIIMVALASPKIVEIISSSRGGGSSA